MDKLLQKVVDRIEEKNPIHAKKIRRNFELAGDGYFEQITPFLKKYDALLQARGKDLDYGVDCYLRMCAEMMYEQVRFQQTGKYSSTSFEEVNARVYNNPEVMEYYMYGLILSDFLWIHHYRAHKFFMEHLPEHRGNVKDYLEIGGGIGLTLSEAMQIFGSEIQYDLVDISPSSIEISKTFVADESVNYHLADIFQFETGKQYDFITMGEVLEHVEDAVGLLKRLAELLKDDGAAFITVPANAPTIDHIYLFRDAGEIRDVIEAAGLRVTRELSVYAEDVDEEKAKKDKIAMLYVAFLEKNPS